VNRAAVIIAVSNAGNLPELRAALDGAKAMAKWAKAQGFSPVNSITDEKKPVTADRIKKAIRKLVDSDSYEQLLVYFAGHGVNLHYSEYWLLSGAPEDTQEAVNVASSVQLAKRCGIPHVVLISDACRTAPEGIRAQAIRGSEIFPNQGRGGPQKAVDVFYAALLGEPALEIQDKTASASRYVSLYTEELLATLRGERRSILTPDVTDPAKVYLRPQPLKRHLLTEVPKLVAARLGPAATQTQTPDAEILSDEFAYLQVFDAARLPVMKRTQPAGRVLGAAPGGTPRAPVATPRPTLADVTRGAVHAVLRAPEGAGGAAVDSALLSAVAGSARLSDAVTREREHFSAMHFETGCGFKLRGVTIGAIHTRPGVHADRLSDDLARIHMGPAAATTVVLELTNGRVVALPALRDFIAGLTFEGAELRNVSYEPSDTSFRWSEYAQRREELASLRAVIAMSVHMGTFRLDREDAPKLTERIRVMKGLDPTMALYAAYSYYRLGKQDLIREMEDYVTGDLGTTLFDLALLADRDGAASAQDHPIEPVVPFVPMLAQGWPLLSAFGGWTPLLDDLRPHLTNSLWTVFDAEALPLLLDALKASR
jgi:hypothetical protein